MKSLSVKLGIVLIGLAIFGYAEVWGADWELFDFNDNSLVYYDAQSITRPSKNVVRVGTKLDYTEKGVLDCMEKVGKQCENLSHAKILLEINCVEKKIRQLSVTSFDSEGGVIYSHSDPSSKWDFINPEMMAESLYKEVCK